ncbi:MAG: PRC-barrel domain-containing protein [Solirubrobacterales bacterium]|nr:PRC-barrel domain-containing protein [Solirubrobacterales bacterium]
MTEPPAPPSLEEATGWIGAEVADFGGGQVGQVEGFFVDDDDGEPVWLIVRLGRRRNTRVVAVPFAGCAGTPSGVWIAYEGEVLQRAPVVDPARPLRREHELTICSHFGIGEAVGRAGEVVGRPEGAITAEPPRH